MKRPVVFHDLAERELNEAVAYFGRARPGLGETFLSAVRRITALVAEEPRMGRAVAGAIRWCLVRRFPYAIVYRATSDGVRVLAVASTKRRPFYWLRRQ